MKLVHSGQPARVPQHIDHTGVAAARHHHQSFTCDLDDHALVVPDHVVGLPVMSSPSVLDREPGLEVGRALDLADDEYTAVDQQSRAALLDHLKPLTPAGHAA